MSSGYSKEKAAKFCEEARVSQGTARRKSQRRTGKEGLQHLRHGESGSVRNMKPTLIAVDLQAHTERRQIGVHAYVAHIEKGKVFFVQLEAPKVIFIVMMKPRANVTFPCCT